MKRIKGKLLYSYRVNKSLFRYLPTRPLVFEQKQVDLEPPFLYLSVLQAFSKQVGISIDQEKQRTIFIYHQGQLKNDYYYLLKKPRNELKSYFGRYANFGTESLSYMRVLQQCQQIAMLNPGLKILLTQEEEQKSLLLP